MSASSGPPSFRRSPRTHRALLVLAACLCADPAGAQDLRCPLESQSISHAEVDAALVGTRRLWPAVLELVNLGLKAVFQEKDLPKARGLFADALDLAQGRWDHGTSAEAAQETAALLLTMGFPASSSSLLSSSASPTSAGLARAFGECPLALSTIYRVLALTHLADAKARESQDSWARAMAVAQRFHHLGYGWLIALYNSGAEQQDPGYIDLAAWPMTGEEWETEKHSVAETLKSLGGAASAARPGVAKSSRIAGLRIAIVTVCAYPEGSLLPHFAASVHRTYTERHGYTYLHHQDEQEHLSAGRPKAWTKIRAMHEALEAGQWDWILWADCDIYFMDLETTLDSLLLRYASRPDVAPPELSESPAPPELSESPAVRSSDALDPRVHLVITEDAQSLNTAIFLMRSSAWSLQLLRSVWGMSEEKATSPSVSPSDWRGVSSPFLNHPWWEQAAFTQQLLGVMHRRFQEPPRQPADASRGGPYPEQVRIAPQREMNSYHVISSRLDEDTTWAPGQFVLSFNGVKSLSGPVVAQVLASNYYDAFCALNGLRERCASDLDALASEPAWRRGGLAAAMFAPWLREA